MCWRLTMRSEVAFGLVDLMCGKVHLRLLGENFQAETGLIERSIAS
jgi:hypothetical protein